MPLTQHTIDRLRDSGVKLCVRRATEEYNDSLYLDVFNHYLADFDLFALFYEMNRHALSYRITWTKRQACIIKLKDEPTFFKIDFTGHIMEQRGQTIEIRRIFRHVDQRKQVEHQRFNLPVSIQKYGFARLILKTFYLQYRNAGIDVIDLRANMEVGGYAWAKYGFRATNKNEVEAIIIDNEKRMSDSDWTNARDIVIDHYRQYGDGAAFPMYLLANKNYGRRLLLGTSWQGKLYLHNREEYDIFEDYLNNS